MRRIDPVTGHHLLLFKGDFDRLRTFHPHDSPTSIIRQLVREHLNRMEGQGPSEVDQLKEFV